MTDNSRQHNANVGTGSVAAIKGHPVHPMLVPIVIGTYVAAVGAHIGFALTRDAFWARSLEWLLLASLGAGALAVIPGLIDLCSIPRARALSAARMHALGNSLFLIVTALDYAWWQPEPAAHHGMGGLILSLVGLGILGVSGWLVGELTYKHGIGVVTTLMMPSTNAMSENVNSNRLTEKFWQRNTPRSGR